MSYLTIAVLCALAITTSAISCYEGETGSIYTTEGHTACGLIFDKSTGNSTAYIIGSRPKNVPTEESEDKISKCDDFEDYKVCTCFFTNCNKPIPLAKFLKTGFHHH